MTQALRRPIDGVFRTWSDGQSVHLMVRFTGGNLGPSPVTMHATTDLAPARAAVRAQGRPGLVSGDPVQVEALATRVGAFSALRRIGRAAKGAAMLATAPVRALGGATLKSWEATTNVAKGLQSAAALTAYATKPLSWRPGKKGSGSPAASTRDREPDAERNTPDEEEPMNDETSGGPRPQARQVNSASRLLRRARFNPTSAKHVQNIAKASAAGHPGARLAQAAITEARKKPAPRPAPSLPPMAPMAPPAAKRSAAFPAWARGAA